MTAQHSSGPALSGTRSIMRVCDLHVVRHGKVKSIHKSLYRGFSRHCAQSIAQVVTTMAAMLDIFLCSITRKKKSNMADAVAILGDDVT